MWPHYFDRFEMTDITERTVECKPQQGSCPTRIAPDGSNIISDVLIIKQMEVTLAKRLAMDGFSVTLPLHVIRTSIQL